jgi:CRP-like cAMP-binding protein
MSAVLRSLNISWDFGIYHELREFREGHVYQYNRLNRRCLCAGANNVPAMNNSGLVSRLLLTRMQARQSKRHTIDEGLSRMARMEQKVLEVLASQPLWRGLGEHQLTEVAQAARWSRLEADGFFFHQEEAATELFLLLHGQVCIAQVTPEGQQVILRIASPGDPFGWVALMHQAVYPASAQALVACETLAWDTGTMAQLMERRPRIALNVLPLLAEQLQDMQNRYRELVTERVERRVARALLRLVRQTGRKVENGVLIDFPLSREDLADITGTTLYTVSRILSGWEKARTHRN